MRRADRAFRVGDVLLLQHYDPEGRRYLGSEVRRHVVYVLKGCEYTCSDYMGVPLGYVVMSIEK